MITKTQLQIPLDDYLGQVIFSIWPWLPTIKGCRRGKVTRADNILSESSGIADARLPLTPYAGQTNLATIVPVI
jgi:hypothetical protein